MKILNFKFNLKYFYLLMTFVFSVGCSKVQQLAETVAQEGLNIVTSSISAAIVNEFYNDNLTASGGSFPYTFTLLSGPLPTGITLNSNGTLSGTPTVIGNYPITIEVTDSAGATANSAFAFVVTSDLTITTASLPAATVGNAYAQAIAVTGGSGAYTFSALGLPTGFTISPTTGIISGTSAISSTNTVTVTVDDAVGIQDSVTYSFSVTSPPVITTVSIPGAGAGVVYTSGAMTVTGGVAPYTWTLDSGTLPIGLSLSTGGIISGTPTSGSNVADSPHSLVVKVTDSFGQSDLQALNLTVTVMPRIVDDFRRQLRLGRTGVAYSDYVKVEGGYGALAYTATGLPAGLTLNATSGYISGTVAAAAADFNVDFTVTDSLGLATTRTKKIIVKGATLTSINYSAPIMTPTGLYNGNWSYPYDTDVKDINGDTFPDIVYAAYDSRGIIIMLGDGTGNFTKYFYANAGAVRTRFVKFAQLNPATDALWDVVTTSADSKIEVFLANAAGWTSAPITKSFNVAVDTYGFDVGDMNGDGVTDIVYTNWANQVRALYNCQGNANVNIPGATACNMTTAGPIFNMHNVLISTPTQPRDIVLHNFDGVGGLDIIATSYNGAAVQITLGAGNGTYGTPYSQATGSTGPRGIIKADMDLDGRMDVVTTGDAGLSVMINTNSGIPATAVTLTATAYANSDLGASEWLAVGDIDADGDQDIAFAIGGVYYNNAGYYYNNGLGGLVNREVITSIGYQAYSMTLAPILSTSVAAGVPDLITAAGHWVGLSRLLVFPNTQAATPFNTGLYNYNASPASAVAVHGTAQAADLDEDGYNDVIFKVGGAANILLGNSAYTYTLSTESVPTGDISSLWWKGQQFILADLNGDDHVDAISGNWNGGGTGTVTAILGEGDGTFGSQYSFSVDMPGCTANLGINALDVGDFNRDSKMDILVGSGCSTPNTPKAFVYFGNADGTFETSTREEVNGVSSYVYLVAAVDINKDGAVDIVTVSNDSSFRQYTNDGTGLNYAAFGSTTCGLGVQNYSSLGVGDFDNNGRLDYVISSNGSSSLCRVLTTATGTVTGGSLSTFTGAAGDYILQPQNGLALLDYDEDGHLDFVTLRRFADINAANRNGGGGIHFYKNNGAGTFTAQSRVLAPAAPGPYMEGMLTTADMNGDGQLDIVNTNAYTTSGSGVGVNMCTSE